MRKCASLAIALALILCLTACYMNDISRTGGRLPKPQGSAGNAGNVVSGGGDDRGGRGGGNPS